jgi:hypothetical protein
MCYIQLKKVKNLVINMQFFIMISSSHLMISSMLANNFWTSECMTYDQSNRKI